MGSETEGTKDAATEAVDQIVKDLCLRSGLQNEWDQIDVGIQQEIKDDWARMIRLSLAARGLRHV